MIRIVFRIFIFMIVLFPVSISKCWCQQERFKVLVVVSRAKDHQAMISAAHPYFKKLALDHGFSLTITDDSSQINTKNLEQYAVFVMLHLAPFDISKQQQAALEEFCKQGKGWVGIHAAGLTGRQFLAPGNPYWQWFEDFMGGITYSPHPAYQPAKVIIEDRNHPVTAHLPQSFDISDEWYEFDKSPRGKVRVLATVDESSYHQKKPMGNHPIIWTNEQYRRMVYIGIGHSPDVLVNSSYTTLLLDAIEWAASK